MRVATTIVSDRFAHSAELARAAEQAGYDTALTTENQHEPFLPLAAATLTTKTIGLGTAVAIAFPRSPMVVANASWDLHLSSAGRFVLGLGSQVKGHNVRRFSVPWSPAAPRMREYVESLKAIWRCWEHGEKLDYRGEHYQFSLMPPNFTPAASGMGLVPVTIAAVGPAMLRVAGHVCDGVRLHPFCTRKYLENVVVPQLQTGFQRGGRARETFEISGGGFLVTGADDATVAKNLEWVRLRVAFYGSTRSYFPVFEEHDLLDLGEKLYRMSVDGQWDQMAAQISDEVVHLFAAVGRHDQITAAVEKHFGGISDTIAETIAHNANPSLSPELVQDLKRLPSSFTGYQS
ncbi:MAG: putative F420-dependent oxidoreductase [Gammaproteobacteria bacterium]|jgi:probable F420-dependent oxidoreductase